MAAAAELRSACELGDASAVVSLAESNGPTLLDAVLDPDTDETALHIAAFHNNVKCVRALLDAGVRVAGHSAPSPLHCAIDLGHWVIAKMLLEHEKSHGRHLALISEQDGSGKTSLILCAATPPNAGGDEACALVTEVLSGAENVLDIIRTRDENGMAALHHAALAHNTACAKALLDASGASPDILNGKDKRGWTPLLYSAAHAKPDCAILLLEAGARTDEVGDGGLSFLHVAALNGRAATIRRARSFNLPLSARCRCASLSAIGAVSSISKALEEAGYSEWGAVDKKGYNALHYAISAKAQGREGDVKEFIRLVAPHGLLASPLPNGMYPIHFAAFVGCRDSISGHVAANGQLVEMKYGNGNSMLHAAAHRQDMEFIDWCSSLFLSEPVNDSGVTPLHAACTTGNSSAVGAKCLKLYAEARDQKGRSPLDFAAACGSSAVVEKLLDMGLSLDSTPGCSTPLHWAAHRGRVQVVLQLLNRGADPNAVDANGRTPLHVAAVRSQSDVVRALLDWPQTRNNIRDNTGATAFLLACTLASLDTVKLFQGGGFDDIGERGRSAAHYVVSGRGKYRKEMVSKLELLRSGGVRLDGRDADGKSALELAAFYGRSDVVEFLLKSSPSLDTDDYRATLRDLGRAGRRKRVKRGGTQSARKGVSSGEQRPAPSGDFGVFGGESLYDSGDSSSASGLPPADAGIVTDDSSTLHSGEYGGRESDSDSSEEDDQYGYGLRTRPIDFDDEEDGNGSAGVFGEDDDGVFGDDDPFAAVAGGRDAAWSTAAEDYTDDPFAAVALGHTASKEPPSEPGFENADPFAMIAGGATASPAAESAVGEFDSDPFSTIAGASDQPTGAEAVDVAFDDDPFAAIAGAAGSGGGAAEVQFNGSFAVPFEGTSTDVSHSPLREQPSFESKTDSFAFSDTAAAGGEAEPDVGGPTESGEFEERSSLPVEGGTGTAASVQETAALGIAASAGETTSYNASDEVASKVTTEAASDETGTSSHLDRQSTGDVAASPPRGADSAPARLEAIEEEKGAAECTSSADPFATMASSRDDGARSGAFEGNLGGDATGSAAGSDPREGTEVQGSPSEVAADGAADDTAGAAVHDAQAGRTFLTTAREEDMDDDPFAAIASGAGTTGGGGEGTQWSGLAFTGNSTATDGTTEMGSGWPGDAIDSTNASGKELASSVGREDREQVATKLEEADPFATMAESRASPPRRAEEPAPGVSQEEREQADNKLEEADPFATMAESRTSPVARADEVDPFAVMAEGGRSKTAATSHSAVLESDPFAMMAAGDTSTGSAVTDMFSGMGRSEAAGASHTAVGESDDVTAGPQNLFSEGGEPADVEKSRQDGRDGDLFAADAGAWGSPQPPSSREDEQGRASEQHSADVDGEDPFLEMVSRSLGGGSGGGGNDDEPPRASEEGKGLASGVSKSQSKKKPSAPREEDVESGDVEEFQIEVPPARAASGGGPSGLARCLCVVIVLLLLLVGAGVTGLALYVYMFYDEIMMELGLSDEAAFLALRH